MSKKTQGDIILIVGIPGKGVLRDLKEFVRKHQKGALLAVIYNKTTQQLDGEQKEVVGGFDIDIPVNIELEESITEALKPFKNRIIAATCRAEAFIPAFQKVIPHVPYLRTPTVRSLQWATDKISMRKRFRIYNKKITPEFIVVNDSKKKTVKEIGTKIGFPVVIKPTSLAQSILVNVVYHPEELEKELRKVFRKLKSAYKVAKREGNPQILVEQYMDGDMYSIDAFVNSRGKVECCPPVGVKTGRAIGFDDFFGYQQMTPTLLNKESIEEACDVATQAIHAVGLRSSSAHVELMKTEAGWKIIELGPRLGGFRTHLYELAYGIDLTANDLYVRYPTKINIPKTVKGHTAALKFFAKDEGYLTSITGIKKAQELASFESIVINKQVGDRATYAKNGGKSVFNITLFNKERSGLLADIRRLEQFVNIEVSKKKPKAKKNTSTK